MASKTASRRPARPSVAQQDVRVPIAAVGSGVQPEVDPETGEETLRSLARRGDFVGVRRAIEELGCDPNSVDHEGAPLLHWAIIGGALSLAAYLLDRGADINARDGRRQTALHWAASRALEPAHLLASRGADLAAVDSEGYTAAHIAAQHGRVIVLEFLRTRGAPLDARDSAGRTLLHWAVYTDQPIAVRWLMENGADALAGDMQRALPLHWAAKCGHHRCAWELLRPGARVSAQLAAVDASGSTAVQVAMQRLHEAPHMAAALRPTLRTLRSAAVTAAALEGRGMWGLYAHPYWLFWVLGAAEFATGGWLYFTLLLPLTSHFAVTNGMFVVLVSLQIYAWYCVCFTDPGYLSGPRAPPSPLLRALQQDYTRRLASGNSTALCPTTRIFKPPRSKFDATSGHVVLRFDHFCTWLNNAVGVRNYRHFVLFLITTVATSTLLNVLTWACVAVLPAPSPGLWARISAHPVLLLFAAHDLFYTVFAGVLLHGHAKLIAQNLTTNEATNWRKYPHLWCPGARTLHNPFDRGTRANVMQFLGLADGWDTGWEAVGWRPPPLVPDGVDQV